MKIITTYYGPNNFKAHIDGIDHTSGFGRTESEAIGDLIFSDPSLFGISIERNKETQKSILSTIFSCILTPS